MEATTLEGTWEEILQHAPQLAGQRVKLTILSQSAPTEPTATPPLPSPQPAATLEQTLSAISRDRQALPHPTQWLDSTALIREDRDR
jgi:hypothetical protein